MVEPPSHYQLSLPTVCLNSELRTSSVPPTNKKHRLSNFSATKDMINFVKYSRWFSDVIIAENSVSVRSRYNGVIFYYRFIAI